MKHFGGKWLLELSLILIVAAVAVAARFAVADDQGGDQDTPSWLALQQELAAVAPQVPAYAISDRLPLAWESSSHPERELWSQYEYSVINTVFDQLDAAQDIKRFCPKYEKLTREQKVETWAQLFVGISYWETGYDPMNHTLEPGQGTDDVTNLPVYSDGLLQLSYDDMDDDGSGQYCHFDWAKDKTLAENDIHRTVFNPYINLFCGIHIMAQQVDNYKVAAPASKVAYWSTLTSDSTLHNRVSRVRRTVGNLPFCGGHHFINPEDVFARGMKDIQTEVKKVERKL